MPLRDHPLSHLLQLPHGRAWALAWPMILSNMSAPLMGLADTAMLGHLDSPVYLAAVALGSSIVALAYWMFAFLRMGTTSQAARALGANDISQITQLLFQNTCFALGLGLGIIALQAWLVSLALWLISPEATLVGIARDYCAIRMFSAPAVLATYVVMGWLIALEKTKAVLVIAVSSNLLNIGLDYVLIVHWELAAKGAATATLIAEACALLYALFYVQRTLKAKGWQLSKRINISGLAETLRLNRDLFIRTTTLLLVFSFFNAQSARLGTEFLAANAILFQFALFASFFLDGYALAAETMTAQAVGGGKLAEFHRASAVTASTAALIATALTLVFIIAGPSIVSLMTNISSVQLTARQYLPWLCAMPLASVACYALDGIYIGAGKAREMRNAMLFSAAVGFFLSWYLLRDFGNHGLWAALVLFNLSRGASLGLDYRRQSRAGAWLV